MALLDNNGRPAQTAWHLPDGTEAPAALLFANVMRARLSALSNNRIDSAKYIVSLAGPVPRTVPATADSRRSLSLFYSGAAGLHRIIIPSPVPGLVETSGPFAGYRVTRETATAAGLLDEIERIVIGTVTQQGDPWPTSFDIGAIDEVV